MKLKTFLKLFFIAAICILSVGCPDPVTPVVEQVCSPVIEPASGKYENTVDVFISCDTSKATIMYTTDGRNDSASMIKYTGPFQLDASESNVRIKAMAKKDNMADSDIITVDYIIEEVTAEKTANPVFSLAEGSYSEDKNVELSCTTSGSEIYYSIDGSEPKTQYSSPIVLEGPDSEYQIRAVAKSSGHVDSDIISKNYSINYSQVSAPIFSELGGNYNCDKNISIQCDTANSTIYYTTDGSAPSTSSTEYIYPIEIAGNGMNVTIKAIAVCEEMIDSDVSEETYYISYDKVSSPVFSPSGGTYNSDQSIELSCSTDGSIIRYTTNGSVPTSSSQIYASPIPIESNGTTIVISAFAEKDGMIDSDVVTSTYIVVYDKVAAPYCSPDSGTFSYDQEIELSCSTSGATIFYTTDGTPPDLNSPIYSEPIDIAGDGNIVTINAFAALEGMESSDLLSETFTISYNRVATPILNPPGGTYSSDQIINVACATDGAVIHYTTDGSEPTALSPELNSTISINGGGSPLTLRVLAVHQGMLDSDSVFGTYNVIYDQVSTPIIDLADGTYNQDQQVGITCTTPGAAIYYTVDGTTPTVNSQLYSGPIEVSGHNAEFTLRAIAIVTGMTNSEISQSEYHIVYDRVATPVINPSGGTFSSDQSVTISCSTNGAEIRYTTDGSTPDSSSLLYSSAIQVSGHGTTTEINAIAIKTEMLDSSIVNEFFNIEYDNVSTPVFEPDGGIYSADQSISMSCATSGAVIHYTTDGAEPTLNSTVYNAPIFITGNGTTMEIKAIAVRNGMVDSNIQEATYEISYSVVDTPVFSPIGGIKYEDTTVSIECATDDAIIYYTDDGTQPDESSKVYTSPILIGGHDTSVNLSALAVKEGMQNSVVEEETYQILYNQVETPIFDPTGGLCSPGQIIIIHCPTTDAIIHYTTNGDSPTLLSAVYEGPFSVPYSEEPVFIHAIAEKEGMLPSEIGAATYNLKLPVLGLTDHESLVINTEEGKINPPSLNFGILNIGYGLVEWEAQVVSGPIDIDLTYGSVTPDGTDWVTVEADIDGLTAGSYDGVIEVSSLNAINDSINVYVTVNIDEGVNEDFLEATYDGVNPPDISGWEFSTDGVWHENYDFRWMASLGGRDGVIGFTNNPGGFSADRLEMSKDFFISENINSLEACLSFTGFETVQEQYNARAEIYINDNLVATQSAEDTEETIVIVDVSQHQGETISLSIVHPASTTWNNFELDYVDFKESTAPLKNFISQWSMEAGEVLDFPVRALNTFTIDWGDGIIEEYIDEINISHIYATDGIYDVIVYGSCLGFGFHMYHENTDDLIDILEWGDMSLNNYGYQFYNCSNLSGFSANDVPNMSNLTNMENMFAKATIFNEDISGWDVSNVTNMRGMFFDALAFNADISGWDTSNVTDMLALFRNADSFNRDISGWDVSNVTDMGLMFNDNDVFNQNLNLWDTSNVKDMRSMFCFADSFNGDVSTWDTSNVSDMSDMFWLASSFSGDVSNWDTSKVTSMLRMFFGADEFNGNIAEWDVANVTDFSEMFYSADLFNQDLSSWDLSSATNLFRMFTLATSFNSDITNWEVANVSNMGSMFYGASSFTNGNNPYGLNMWNIDGECNTQDIFYACPLNPRPVWYTHTIEAPEFSLAPGTYTSEQNIELTCNVPNAIIYYTTNGNVPTESSIEYTLPILLNSENSPLTIRAIAVLPDIAESEVVVAEYTIVSGIEAPHDLSVQELDNHTVFLSWAYDGTDQSGFQIERSCQDDESVIVYNLLDPDSRTFEEYESLNLGTYNYRCRALNEEGLHSDWTNYNIISILHNDDSSLNIIALSDGTLSPEFSSDCFEYEIKVGTHIDFITLYLFSTDQNAEIRINEEVSGTLNSKVHIFDTREIDYFSVSVLAEDGISNTMYEFAIIKTNSDI